MAAPRHASFEHLVADQKEMVFRVALAVLGPGQEADAEDVTQEVFIRAHGAIHSFRGESTVATWLYRIAYRAAVDVRRSARYRFIHIQADEAVGELDPSARDSDLELRRCLERLPDIQRTVLHLHYWMGYSVAEIGRLLHRSDGTIKSHLHRARQRIRGMIRPGKE